MRLAVLGAAVVCGLSGCGPSKEELAEQAKNEEIFAFVTAAKGKVARALFDPASAEFRDLGYAESEGHPYLCGEVNGNNRYGAKAGFIGFLAGNRADGQPGLAASLARDGNNGDQVIGCRTAWAELAALDEAEPVPQELTRRLRPCRLPDYDAEFWLHQDEVCKSATPVPDGGLARGSSYAPPIFASPGKAT